MSALTILIIRHAEKPADPRKPVDLTAPQLGVGMSATGAEDPHSLVVRGWQRAGSWAVLFASGAFGPDYPKPAVIYAASPSKPAVADDMVSKRGRGRRSFRCAPGCISILSSTMAWATKRTS